MCENKNHLNLVDLQRICEQLGLSTEGTKSELIAKILQLNSNDVLKSDISRFCVFRANSMTPQKCDQSTQTIDESFMSSDIIQTVDNNLFRKMFCIFLIIVFAICVFGGFYSIFDCFASVEKIEIPVKHNWFNFWSG